MSISKIRSALYGTARVLGDVQAVKRAAETGSAAPIEKRITRRLIGRGLGLLMRELFK